MSRTASPAVTRARLALSVFSPRTREEAATLLGLWSRRDSLTEAEVAEILRDYTPQPPNRSGPV